jgi:hypothetical protein
MSENSAGQPRNRKLDRPEVARIFPRASMKVHASSGGACAAATWRTAIFEKLSFRMTPRGTRCAQVMPRGLDRVGCYRTLTAERCRFIASAFASGRTKPTPISRAGHTAPNMSRRWSRSAAGARPARPKYGSACLADRRVPHPATRVRSGVTPFLSKTGPARTHAANCSCCSTLSLACGPPAWGRFDKPGRPLRAVAVDPIAQGSSVHPTLTRRVFRLCPSRTSAIHQYARAAAASGHRAAGA